MDAAALNALTAQWAAAKADLDDSENRTRINYNSALDQLRRQNQGGFRGMAVSAADRGMTHSGVFAQQQARYQDEFNRRQGIGAQQQALDLSTIARKRLEADNAYNTQRILL